MLTITNKGLSGRVPAPEGAAPGAHAVRGKQVVLAVLVVTALFLCACGPPGPRALLDGKKRLDRGQPEKAVEKLELAISHLPTNALAWEYLGLAYHQAGRAEEAEKAYRQALSFDRTLSEARYNLGCLYLEQSRAADAKSVLTAFTLENDQNIPGFLKLGSAASRAGDLAEAERAFSRALKLSPEHPEALTGLGVVRQKRGRTVEAVDCFTRALRSDPQYGPALLNYGILARQHLKDRPLALKLFQQYLNLKPTPTNSGPIIVALTDLQRELAAAAITRTNTAPAVSPGASKPSGTSSAPVIKPEVESAVNKQPVVEPKTTPATAQNSGSTTTVRLPEQPVIRPASPTSAPVEAASRPKQDKKSVFTKIFGSKPTPTNASPQSIGTNATSTATAGINRYAYANPPKPAAGDRTKAERLFSEAIAARKAYKVTEAIKLYRQAVQVDPTFYNAHFNLALALVEANDLQGAARAYESALAARPDSFDARYNLALLLKQMDHPLDSIQELEKLTRTNAGDARAHVIMGNIYAQQLKQNVKAREHYTRALQLDPRNAQADAIRSWLANPAN